MSLVLHAQEIIERGFVPRVRESRPVDVFGVKIAPRAETIIEDSRQLTIAHDGDLRIPSGGVKDQHLLLVVGGGRDRDRTEHRRACDHQ